MKILVVGGKGQLAQSLVDRSIDRKEEVVAIGRPEIDLLNIATFSRAMDQVEPDFVINAAAYTLVDKAETEPDLAFAINADAVGQMAGRCAENKLPFLHVSTDYVFDGCQATAYRETDSANPVTVYGKSKLQGEALVQAHSDMHIILRTAWVHSPFGSNFVRTMLRLANDRDVIGVVGDQKGSPTFAMELADLLLQLTRTIDKTSSEKVPWGIFHAAGSGSTTWTGLAGEVFSCSKKLGGPFADVRSITTDEFPTTAVRPKNSTLACDKLNEEFGLKLPDWQKGVADCVERCLRIPVS